MKNTLTTKALATTLCVSLLASSMNSCQNMSDETLTQTQGGVAGGLAAGIVAGGITALATGDVKKALIVGGAAAVAGAFVGVAWGNSVVKEKQAYASTEEYLNANIQQLDTRIAEANKYNSDLQKSIASMKEKKEKYSAEQYQRLAQNLDTNISLIDQDINTAKLAIQEAGGSDVSALRQKLTTLEGERNALASSKDDLAMLQTI